MNSATDARGGYGRGAARKLMPSGRGRLRLRPTAVLAVLIGAPIGAVAGAIAGGLWLF